MWQNPLFRLFLFTAIGFLVSFALCRLVRWNHARAIKRRWRYGAALLLLPLLLMGTGCATGGTIRAAAVDGAFRRVAARHDAYIAKDVTLTPAARAVYLQDSQFLRGILDEANKTLTPAATVTSK